MTQTEVHRLSLANDEIPELYKRVKILEESQETHTATLTHIEVYIYMYVHKEIYTVEPSLSGQLLVHTCIYCIDRKILHKPLIRPGNKTNVCS